MKEQVTRHKEWSYYPMGLNGSLSGERANQIIGQIMDILKEQNITVYVAKQLLDDTKESIDKEAVLDKYL